MPNAGLALPRRSSESSENHALPVADGSKRSMASPVDCASARVVTSDEDKQKDESSAAEASLFAFMFPSVYR
jgi:hypothetical protein